MNDKQTSGKKWWLPLVFSLGFTPIAIFLAIVSHGFGHGSGWADDILFPLHRPLRIAINSEVMAENLIYFFQYLIYGLFLSYASYRGRFKIALALLIVFHVCCYFSRDLISNMLIHAGF